MLFLMKARANWMGWCLQFIAGILAGVLLGFFFITRRHHGIWMAKQCIAPFLAGCGIAIGGAASLWGDQLWLSAADTMQEPEAPEHNATSVAASIMAIAVGALLAIISVMKHLQT